MEVGKETMGVRWQNDSGWGDDGGWGDEGGYGDDDGNGVDIFWNIIIIFNWKSLSSLRRLSSLSLSSLNLLSSISNKFSSNLILFSSKAIYILSFSLCAVVMLFTTVFNALSSFVWFSCLRFLGGILCFFSFLSSTNSPFHHLHYPQSLFHFLFLPPLFPFQLLHHHWFLLLLHRLISCLRCLLQMYQ